MNNTDTVWKPAAVGVGDNGIVFGVKIFDLDWKSVGMKAEVIDPLYGVTKSFNVYTVTIGGKKREFAAGEFSNGVWGFYVRNGSF